MPASEAGVSSEGKVSEAGVRVLENQSSEEGVSDDEQLSGLLSNELENSSSQERMHTDSARTAEEHAPATVQVRDSEPPPQSEVAVKSERNSSEIESTKSEASSPGNKTPSNDEADAKGDGEVASDELDVLRASIRLQRDVLAQKLKEEEESVRQQKLREQVKERRESNTVSADTFFQAVPEDRQDGADSKVATPLAGYDLLSL